MEVLEIIDMLEDVVEKSMAIPFFFLQTKRPSAPVGGGAEKPRNDFVSCPYIQR